MACQTEKDCDNSIHMICKNKNCECKIGFILVKSGPQPECYPKVTLFAPCNFSDQCRAMHPNTFCNTKHICACSPSYFFNGRECTFRYDGHNLKAQEVYKAAVVAAACFIVAVVGIFVACIVRRSFCRREHHLRQSESNRENDIFSISDEIAALRAVDKPPSYEEVLQIERTFYGIPPPEYTACRSNLATLQQLPTSCASVQTNNDLYCTQESLSNATCTTSIGESINAEMLKENNHSLTEGSLLFYSAIQPITQTNFLTTAEVIPLPHNVEPIHSSSLQESEVYSNTLPSNHLSYTPPPRSHRMELLSTYKSSSLPSSPCLSSPISIQSTHAVNVVMLRNQLISRNSQSSESNSSLHLSPQNETMPNESLNNNDSCASSQNNHAYDNPGFVSDFHA